MFILPKFTSQRMEMDTGWNVCPPEILSIIFRYLDITALSRCMRVNSKWKAIIEHMVEQYNLWEIIVKTEISNAGATFLQKSRLNWRKIYRNTLLWNYVKSANINHLYTYELQDVKKISVHNGNLILINGSCAIYYDMNTFKRVTEMKCKNETIIKHKPIGMDLEESNNVIAELIPKDNNLNELNFYDKTELDQGNVSAKIVTLLDIKLFKLEGNSCFTICKDNILRVLERIQKKWKLIFLGRCYISNYDRIVNLYIWNEPSHFNGQSLTLQTVFLTSKYGTVWCHTSHMDQVIYRAYKYETPDNASNHDWVMFGKRRSVIPVTSNDNNERVTVQYDESAESTMLQCAGLTSTMPHDDVLLLGYSDGTVEIRLSKKNMKNSDLARRFNIQQFSNEDDSAVVALNVYEIEDSHILFVSTRKRVFQLQLTYSQNIISCVNNYL